MLPVLGKQTDGFLVYHHSTLGEVQVSEQLFQKTRWVASCSVTSTYICTNVHQHTCAHTYTHLESRKSPGKSSVCEVITGGNLRQNGPSHVEIYIVCSCIPRKVISEGQARCILQISNDRDAASMSLEQTGKRDGNEVIHQCEAGYTMQNNVPKTGLRLKLQQTTK